MKSLSTPTKGDERAAELRESGAAATKDLLQQGVESLGRGDLQEAAFYFEEVISRDPLNSTAESYLKYLGDSTGSARRTRSAVFLEPEADSPRGGPAVGERMGPPPKGLEYEVLSKLAQGGICDIYLAQEVVGTNIGRKCVLKMLRDRYIGDPNLLGALRTESQIMSRLRHPNIVQFYGSVQVGHRDGIALELLDGTTVHSIQNSETCKPNVVQSLAIMGQIFQALGYVHELKAARGRDLEIVHRDVAPGNIFVTSDGRVKLLDFGVSRWSDNSLKTKQGVIKGTPCFMSPEQAQGQPVSHRSDLFSAGVVLLSLLTGERSPFLCSSLGSTLVAVSENLRPPVAELLPDVPSALSDILERTLATAPARRPATAMEVATVLGQVMTQLGAGAPRAELQSLVARTTEPPIRSHSTVAGVRAPPPRRPVLRTEQLAEVYESIVQGPSDQVPTEPAARPLSNDTVDETPPYRGTLGHEESAGIPARGSLPAIDLDRAMAELLLEEGSEVSLVGEHATPAPEDDLAQRPLSEDEAETLVVPTGGLLPAAALASARAASSSDGLLASSSSSREVSVASGIALLQRSSPTRRLGAVILGVAVVSLLGIAAWSQRSPMSARLRSASPPSRARMHSPALNQRVSSLPPAAVTRSSTKAEPASETVQPHPVAAPPPPPKLRAKSRPRVKSRRARRIANKRRAQALKRAGGTTRAVLNFECDVPWALEVVGYGTFSAAREHVLMLPVGNHRLKLSRLGRLQIMAVELVEGSPANIPCPR